MKYWSTKPLIAVIALIGAFSLGISGALVYSSLTSAQENSSENSSSIMYFLNSESGNLEKSGDNTYLLTLNQTSTSIIWFTDRPERLADTVSTSTFVDSWQKLGFTEDPPNITMTLESLEPASPEVSVVATMTNPTYDVYSGIFTAELTIILEEDLAQNGGQLDLVKATSASVLPQNFTQVSLFIDNSGYIDENGKLVLCTNDFGQENEGCTTFSGDQMRTLCEENTECQRNLDADGNLQVCYHNADCGFYPAEALRELCFADEECFTYTQIYQDEQQMSQDASLNDCLINGMCDLSEEDIGVIKLCESSLPCQ